MDALRDLVYHRYSPDEGADPYPVEPIEAGLILGRFLYEHLFPVPSAGRGSTVARFDQHRRRVLGGHGDQPPGGFSREAEFDGRRVVPRGVCGKSEASGLDRVYSVRRRRRACLAIDRPCLACAKERVSRLQDIRGDSDRDSLGGFPPESRARRIARGRLHPAVRSEAG